MIQTVEEARKYIQERQIERVPLNPLLEDCIDVGPYRHRLVDNNLTFCNNCGGTFQFETGLKGEERFKVCAHCYIYQGEASGLPR